MPPDSSQNLSPLEEALRLFLIAALAASTHSRGTPQAGTGRELAGDSKGGSAGGSADDLLPLTLPEACRLLARLAWKRLVRKEESLHWSRWRRRHQMRAKRCHYRSRGATFHG